MDQRYPHPAWIEIDLSQFKKNIQIIRRNIGDSLFCLPVKANAYGHGLCPMGKAAAEAGVDCLGVSCLQEGVSLRKSGIEIPILVLGAIHEDQLEDLTHFNLEFSISSKFKADLVAKKWENKKVKCRVHLEVDTGMQRTGVRCSTAVRLYEHLSSLECFDVVGVYSHLASADQSADPIALHQIESFKNLFNHSVFSNPGIRKHIANSGGTLFFPEAHLDMVRPGLAAFGYLPENYPDAFRGIAPCFTLKAKVSYFKVVEEGKGIGYGHTYITSKQTRIVTIPIGYGDGYSRSLSNRGSVLVRGRRFPIAGTLCMDQFMVDVGDQEANVGVEAALIGKQGGEELCLGEVARLSNTIPYEIPCSLNDRTPRFYI